MSEQTPSLNWSDERDTMSEQTPSLNWSVDWHDEFQRESFVATAMTALIIGADDRSDTDILETVSERSDRMRALDVRMEINGVPVDVQDFMRRYVQDFSWAVERRAQEIVEESEEILDIDDQIESLRHAVVSARRDVVQSLIEKGLIEKGLVSPAAQR